MLSIESAAAFAFPRLATIRPIERPETIEMIAALAGLLFCQLAGEVAVRALALPVPGPVAGLALMFAFLLARARFVEEPAVPRDLGRVADAFLENLSLLFVPAAVGIVQYLDLLGQFAGPIALTIVISTTTALAVTALVFRLVARLQRGSAGAGGEPAP